LARLNEDQIIDSPCGNDYRNSVGNGGCFLDRTLNGTVVACVVTHNVIEATSVGIFSGAAGTEGELLNAFPVTNPFYEDFSFLLSTDDDDTEEAALLSGEWYISVMTDDCPSGIIRGQLTNSFNVWAVLDGFNEIPPVVSNTNGFAVSDYNVAQRRLNSFIQYNTPDVFSVTLNQGSQNDVGIDFYTFNDRSSPIDESYIYIEPREDELYHNQHFYNVLSEDNPLGAIRGQLHVLDATPNINFAVMLRDPSNPNNKNACGLFSLLCTNELEYMVSHNMDNIVSAAVYDINTQDIVFNLNGIRSPIIGKQELSNSLIASLLNEDLFIVLESANGQELEAEIRPEFPFYAYLTGSEEVPRVSTLERGCALFDFDIVNGELDYHIFYNTPNAQIVEFRDGNFGEIGQLEEFIPIVNENFENGTLVLSAEQQAEILSEDWYIEIVTSDTGLGLIRGQILFALSDSNCNSGSSESSNSDSSASSSSDSSSTTYGRYYLSSERYFDFSGTIQLLPTWFAIGLTLFTILLFL